jgi:mycothiol synthase
MPDSAPVFAFDHPWPLADATGRELDGLIALCEAGDRREALSEARTLELAAPLSEGGKTTRATIARDADGHLVGYAQLGADESDGGRPLECLVEPGHRTEGLWRSLLAHALDDANGAGATAALFWTANEDAARTIALAALHPTAARALWQVRIRLPRRDAVRIPAGVEIRDFRPGVDDEAWLAVNKASFAHHPEQGHWTLDDLRERIAQPWFDPTGFHLAWRGEELLGFCWTKVHAPTRFDPELGEIYVIGVAPSAQGLGLGLALVLIGLASLSARGVEMGMLYVDDDNAAARSLYAKLGFTNQFVNRAWRIALPARIG